MILVLSAFAGTRVVEGPRTAEDLEPPIAALADRVLACNGTDAASITFDIDATGSVAVVRAVGAGQACLTRLFGTLSFPAAEGAPTRVVTDWAARRGIGTGAGAAPPVPRHAIEPIPVGIPLDTGFDPQDPTNVERPSVSGALDSHQVRDAVRRRSPQIRQCFDQGRATDPSLDSGRVQVRFLIDGQGSVTSAWTDSSTLNNFTVEQCVVGEIQRIRFPSDSSGRNTDVGYPMVFAP
ncbi:MAG: AgmX/PglI C-terminal domain-containing protein [Alphaproteobacteria bacterium]|nr:AgmX/PglI C-terminal domain-containing protein [Alphaproteobacteria bacterium]